MVGNAAPVFVCFFLLNMLDSRSNMFFGTVASNTAIDFNPRIAAARSMLTTGVLVIGVAWRFFRCTGLFVVMK